MVMALPAHSQKTKEIVEIATSGGGEGGGGGGDGGGLGGAAADLGTG